MGNVQVLELALFEGWNSWNQPFWTDSKNYLVINSKVEKSRQQQIIDLLNSSWPSPLNDVILIPSSGTTSNLLKLVILKKETILQAAKRSMDFLDSLTVSNSNSCPKWLLSLPIHHIAGLSILARSFIAKSDFYFSRELKVKDMYNLLSMVDHISLVPTQLYDLVQLNLNCPSSVKLILMGGAATTDSLFQSAKKLNYPLLFSFGMTETSAFFATSKRPDDLFKTLPGISIKSNSSQQLLIKTDSLAIGYFIESARISAEFNHDSYFTFEPLSLKNNFWTSYDRIEFFPDDRFKLLGRDDSLIKIMGELVDVERINSEWQNLIDQNLANNYSDGFISRIWYVPNPRTTNELFLSYQLPVIFSEQEKEHLLSTIKSTLKHLNENLLPFEHCRWVIELESIKLTDLNKIKMTQFTSESFKKKYYENRKLIDAH